MQEPSRIDILGLPVDALRRGELLARAERFAAGERRATVLYLNVHVANTARRSPALAAALRRADLVYCDGEGVRLGARLLGARLPERMTGADFAGDVAALCARRGFRLYWLGGEPEVAGAALEVLAREHRGLTVAGSHHGYFARQGGESDEVIRRVNAARPHVVLVGLGTPAQEIWVDRNREALEAPLVWCIGATADFLTGGKPRAPRWMRERGLEWLHRLASEPRRLFGRYAIGNPLFLARVLRQRCAGGTGARLRDESGHARSPSRACRPPSRQPPGPPR